MVKRRKWTGRKWTNKEKEILKKYYATGNTKELAKRLNRTIRAIQHQAKEQLKIDKNILGKYNHNWKGNKVTLEGLHDYIKYHKPKSELCECCKQRPPRDLANISGKYKRDTNDYEWLCRRCHMRKDGRINNLKQFKDEKNKKVKNTKRL